MTEAGDILLLTCTPADNGVTITLSNGEILELAAESLPPALPSPGGKVGPEALAALRAGAARKEIARRIFRLLDRRLYTRAGLSAKLRDAGFAREPVDAVLDRFAAEGLVSDRHYAEAYCRDTLRQRPVGRRYLVSKLRGKGVDGGLARDVAAAVLPDEREVAEDAARRWWARRGGPADASAVAAAVRYLIGRGFPAGAANAAARAAAPPRGDEA